jgi:hypothetical protein
VACRPVAFARVPLFGFRSHLVEGDQAPARRVRYG